MKTILVTTPIRPVPDHYPPMGSLSLLTAVRESGVCDIEFYNIDALRPTYEEALAHIVAAKPGVLAISAVVSTAYAYTKRLSLDVKKALPDTLIIVGGNLAASAEILLRRTGVQLCALGEGEVVFVNMLRRALTTRDPIDFKDVKGLALLDRDGTLINTGYEESLPREQLYRIDWNDIEERRELFIFDAVDADDRPFVWFAQDPRAYEPARRKKKVATLVASKGCVARCTFCHRWDKGIRYIPASILKERVQELTEKYDVGFIAWADENFGTDKRWLAEFIEMIKPFDVLWQVAGMRTNCITPEFIVKMKEAGCTSITYGMETGSPRMLEIMEKKTKIEDNRNAAKWTVEQFGSTVPQFVVGMPGETSETIAETIEFCKYVTTLSPSQSPSVVSVNYAQALPGTPVYEFARHKGIIPADIDGEENYLLGISDKDASEMISNLNFTDSPRLVWMGWQRQIHFAVKYNYACKYGIRHYREVVFHHAEWLSKGWKTIGYAAGTDPNAPRVVAPDLKFWPLVRWAIRHRSIDTPFPFMAWRLRKILIPLHVLWTQTNTSGWRSTISEIREYFKWLIGRGRRRFGIDYKSLRKIVGDDLGVLPQDDPAMAPLRRGRW